jgi:hypothetical protein
MKFRSRFPLLLVVASCAFFAGCGESGPTEPGAVSALGFSYSGERTGTYHVRGDVRLNGEQRPSYGTWAAALQVPGSDLSITAARAGTAPVADVFLIALHNISAPGTYPLDRGCTQDTPASCALGMFAFNYDWDSSARAPDPYYLLVSGTVTITALDANRVRGTFQVGGVRAPAGSAAISLDNGSFEVPVLHSLPVRASMVPLWSTLEAIRSRP